jgi:multidrug efflux pump
MSYLPRTLMITLGSSLFVALLIVPPLCAMFMRLDSAPTKPLRPAARWTLAGAAILILLVIAGSSVLAAVLLAGTAVAVYFMHTLVLARIARVFQDRGVPFVVDWYERRLRWALDHRGLIMAGVAGVFVGSIALFSMFNSGSEFFPESIPPSSVIVRIDVPSGTAATFTDGLAARVESRLSGFEGMRDAESVVTTVSSGEGGGFMGGSAEGNVTVNFVKFDARTTDAFETLRQMQANVADGLAGADVKVEKPDNGPPTGKPISIEIVGPDVDEVKRLAGELMATLKGSTVFNRLEGLHNDLERGRPELVVVVDRERAAMYELSTSQVGNTVRTAIQGAEAAKFRSGKDEYDIVVRLAEAYRNDLEALRDLTVMADGRQIPLLSVASWHVDEGLGTVKRKDLDRVATISSDVRSGEQSNAVLADVRRVLAPFAAALPPGYSLRYTGQQEEQMESMQFLGRAFLIAMLIIAFILMSQFNSVLKPLIIMTSVIMSTVGVLLGLIVFRMPFGIIMTGVGVISLAGVVVNNAIVLIDYIDLLRERGLSRREAVVQAGRTRFRPVILTAITTVLGLVPLAIGFNIDFGGLFTSLAPNIYWGGDQAAWWGPMAIAVIAGLTFATVLTLGMVPVLYSLLDDLGDAFARYYTHDAVPALEAGATPAALPRRRRGRLAGAAARFGMLRTGTESAGD